MLAVDSVPQHLHDRRLKTSKLTRQLVYMVISEQCFGGFSGQLYSKTICNTRILQVIMAKASSGLEDFLRLKEERKP